MKVSFHSWVAATLIGILSCAVTAPASELTPKQQKKSAVKHSDDIVRAQAPTVKQIAFRQQTEAQSAAPTPFGEPAATPAPVVPPAPPAPQAPVPVPVTPVSPAPVAPTPVIPATPAPPAPVQIVNIIDPTTEAMLAKMQADIDQLRRDMPKKSNTKKSWGAPKIGGRMFFDSVNYADQNDQSKLDDGDIQNDLGLRELFLSASGEGFDSFAYKVEVGFSSGGNDAGKVTLVDCYVDAKNVPLFNLLRIGHFKPENGFSYVGSGNTITLMEPSGPSTAFHTGRRLGISSQHYFWDKKARWMFGLFANRAINMNRYNVNDYQGWMLNSRLTMAPVYFDDGHFFHIGASWLYAEPGHKSATGASTAQSLSYRPGAFSHSPVACQLQMAMDSNRYNKVGAEFIAQRGAFAIDGEFYLIAFNGDEGMPGFTQDRTAYGGYLEARYFLTGDYRSYNQGNGTLGAVKMKRNFHPFKAGDYNLVDSLGAWEIVTQWNFVDLTDWEDINGMNWYGTTVNAGLQNDFTLGLNWFWTPNLRWVFEYVHSTRAVYGKPGTLECDIVAASFRLHF